MNTVKFDSKNALVVAHRGLSGIERENTCAAFVAAANRSYFGIETDIYRTADGRFVCNHDGNALRVGGDNISMEETTWDTLKKLVLFDMDGSKGREDLHLPSLENYVSICKKYDKHCILELKSLFTDEETEAFVEIIKDIGYLEGVTFISFHYDDLVKVKRILPNQPCQYLTGDNSDELIARLASDRMDIDIYHASLNKERVDAMHAAGLKINCWTVDDPARAEELASWGVDYITSNILEGKQ